MAIDCVFCIRDENGTYHQTTYTALTSVFENTRKSVHVHLITDSTLDPYKQRFQELCDQYGQTITFYRAPESIPAFVLRAIPSTFGRASLYRFFIFDLLDVPKAIYLDSDIICERDLDDLYSIDMQNHLVAAVHDAAHWDLQGKTRDGDFLRMANLQRETYFNSGVLLLNVEKIRRLFSGSVYFLHKLKKQATCRLQGSMAFPDQDVLNTVFTGNKSVLYLDESFNYLVAIEGRLFSSLQDFQGKIVHFVKSKPFEEFYPAHLLFWKYYARTPWKETMFSMLTAAEQPEKTAIFKAVCTHPSCYRRLYDIAELGMYGAIKKRIEKNLGRLQGKLLWGSR